MNNTSIESSFVRREMDLIKAITNPIILLVHICNITIILSKKQLRKNGMCVLLVNLSLSDLLALAFYSLEPESFPHLFLMSVVVTSSLLSTLGISLDKYLSIKYSLRYHSIVTQKKIVLFLGFSWVISTIFAAVTTLLGALTDESKYYYVLHYVQRLIISLLLLFCSAYIRHVRNAHEKQITLRNKQFGVQAEQLNILKRLRRSVVDVMRLNCTTAFAVITVTILGAIWRYSSLEGNNVVTQILRAVCLFYLCSNPIIYIIVTSALRKEYSRITRRLCCCKTSRNSIVSHGSWDWEFISDSTIDGNHRVIHNSQESSL